MSHWLLWTFAQVSPFTLRLSVATATVGATALVPSPACVKLALVNAAFATFGTGDAPREVFDAVKPREIAIRVPRSIVVQQTFQKVLVPWEPPKTRTEAGDRARAYEADLARHHYPFKSTIAYTEIATWSGPIQIALNATGLDMQMCHRLHRLASSIRFLGRRGSFVQLLEATSTSEPIRARLGYARRADYVRGDDDWPAEFIQRPCDDFSQDAEFDRVNVATSRPLRAGDDTSSVTDRLVALPLIIPMVIARTGKRFSQYVSSRPNDSSI